MNLRLVSEHHDDAYPEIGEVMGLFWNHHRSIFAVASIRLSSISRVLPRRSSRHCQRLSLYDAATKRLIASVSGLYQEILDVCFHPTEPSLIVGTGAYDGGFCFQGELLLWNWSTHQRKILAGYPSFYRVRYTSPTDIEILISPTDEEDIDLESHQDAFKIFRLVSVSLASLGEKGIPDELLTRPLARDVDPSALGFKPIAPYSDERRLFQTDSWNKVAELLGIREPRGTIVDILATGSQLFTVRDRPVLERRALSGERLEAIHDSFSGIQVFPLGSDRLLINTDQSGPLHRRPQETRGRLLVWDGTTGQTEIYLEGPNPFLVSQSAAGAILARSSGHYSEGVSKEYRDPIGVDFIIDRQLRKTPTAPLGSIGHLIYLTTKGSKRLYYHGLEFPSPGWSKKLQPRLLILTIEESGKSRVVDFLGKPLPSDAPYAYNSLNPEIFCAYPTTADEDLIVAGDGCLTLEQAWKGGVWRHDPSKQAVLWHRQFNERARLLLSLPSRHAVLVGFDHGILRLLDAQTGHTLDEKVLSFAGIPSLPSAACLDGEEIVLATIEGRILRFAISHP